MTGVAPALRQSTFSTDHLAPEHRLDAWTSALAGSHSIDAAPAGFFGRVLSVQAGRVALRHLVSAPIALERSAARIRRDGLDDFVLHLSHVPIKAVAAGQTLDISAGCISVNDLSKPTLRCAAAEKASLVAVIPRELMREALRDCDTLHGRVLHSATSALLAAHLRNIVDNAAAIPEAAGPALALATAQLAAACLTPNARSIGEAAPAIEAAKLTRARRFIEANLSRPELTPEAIGRAVGLSRSALFRVFEPLGGVSSYLWSRRLRAVHRALQDGHDARTIGQLGQEFGFTSSSHLSRAFRREFGDSPRGFRNDARGGASGPR